MVKGRRKSRSKSSGDFNNPDNDECEGDSGCWRKVNIAGEGIYEGNMKDGLRDGQGRQKDPKGGCFVGCWVKGLQSGFGVKNYKSGDRHEGNYVEGKRSGNGIYMWNNGDVYSGEWSKGFIEGKGSFTWASGDKYIGNWFKGEIHGEGVKSQKDGSVLEGSFFRGKAHGSVRKEFLQGDVYKGNYVMDIREGYGEYVWADGSIYRGSWKCDKMTGFGEKIVKMPISMTERCTLNFLGVPDSVLAYRGSFVDGKRCGKGTAVLSDCRRYTGDWKDDTMCGWGRIEDPLGSYYEGAFESGHRHGMGILVFPPSRKSHQMGEGQLEALNEDKDKNDIDFMLAEEVLTSSSSGNWMGVEDENGGGGGVGGEWDDADDVLDASLFDYTPNESGSVEFLLLSCRNFKRKDRPHTSFKAEAIGFYDFENCCTYRGSFVHDKPEGIGIIELRNGQTYQGSFYQGAIARQDTTPSS